MSRQASSLAALEKLVASFNRRTGRPSRAYDPGESEANIGHAYARCTGAQNDNRYVVSVITNSGGGVSDIPGLSGRLGELIVKFREKLRGVAWVAEQRVDASRWRKPIRGIKGGRGLLDPIDVAGTVLQVLHVPEKDTHCLVVGGGATLAIHPNAHSCYALRNRIVYESEQRVKEQADFIEVCGGSVSREDVTEIMLRLHGQPDSAEEDNPDACRECGAPTDNGEGYDGLCGNCADKADPCGEEE